LPISSSESTISLANVSKEYNLSGPLEIRRLAGRVKDAISGQHAHPVERRYALRDLSIEVRGGETLGVIGHNGAGKTTLLRLLAGVTLPTSGRVRITGRVAALIGLGIGFHPDLSGRENARLYCSLMQFSRREIPERVEQILEFAEIGDYVDAAFKRYSSGMMARLGFAAAICVEPDVLLLDEVLAVGDLSFYQKSRAALAALAARCTVVLVSHSLDAVPEFCQRAIWIDHGRLRADGPSASVVQQYWQSQMGTAHPTNPAIT
jgi:ABC-type polysaccharide/polyol phosphate transport system ATPase subunit